MTKWRCTGILILSAAGVAACFGAGTVLVSDIDQPSTDRSSASGRRLEELENIPWPTPGPMSGSEWAVPVMASSSYRFPLLPEESPGVSRSWGDVTTGGVYGAKRVMVPHPSLAFLGVHHQRQLHFATDEMIDLLTDSAARVRQAHPQAIVHLGNLGHEYGGDIPYSVSHNSGRDADLAFFLSDKGGNPITLTDLIELDETGTAVLPDGKIVVFDVARNWTLVESLIREGDERLQYVFVSNPLRRMLLQYASRTGVETGIRRSAAELLVQPGGALPHNDHFHVRIYCSKVDMESGCVNRGRWRSKAKSHRHERKRVIQRATKLLASEGSSGKLAALRRLDLMVSAKEARKLEPKVTELLTTSSHPKVRAQAARFLGRHRLGRQALVKRFRMESHPHVYVEVIDAISQIGNSKAIGALSSALEEARDLVLSDVLRTDQRKIIADVLSRTESLGPVPELVKALSAEDPSVRVRASVALHYLTNHKVKVDWERGQADDLIRAQKQWDEWIEAYGLRSRERWLVEGFRLAGFDVSRLHLNEVWDLARAITAADYLSYNAQRVLMKLSGHEARSLHWPKNDASFYWRRWFERREKRFGCPPIPEELSTLQQD